MEEEEWKQISNFNYDISTLGRIRHRSTKHYITPSIVLHNCLRVSLWHEGKAVKRMLKILVAEAWIPNPSSTPNEAPRVIHINGDPKDVRASNLQWTTRAEVDKETALRNSKKVLAYLKGETEIKYTFANTKEASTKLGITRAAITINISKRTHYSTANDGQQYYFRYEDSKQRITRLPPIFVGEWKQIPCIPLYEANTDGLIRCFKNKKQRRLQVLEGYQSVHVTIKKGKKVTMLVHRLIAETFLPSPSPDQTQINHKNGNRSDNRVSNIEWCTPRENSLHAFRVLNRKRTGEIPVEQLDERGNAIKRYKNISEASEESGICDSTIRRCIKGNQRTTREVRWRRVDDKLKPQDLSELTNAE